MPMLMGVGYRFFQGQANGKDKFLAQVFQTISIQYKSTSGLNHLRQWAGKGSHHLLTA